MKLFDNLDELAKTKKEIQEKNAAKDKKNAEEAHRIKQEISDSAEGIAKKANSSLNKLWGIDEKKKK